MNRRTTASQDDEGFRGYISLLTQLQDSTDELETYRSTFLTLALRRARDKGRIM